MKQKSGETNYATDALSRRKFLLKTRCEEIVELEWLKELYKEDEIFGEI